MAMCVVFTSSALREMIRAVPLAGALVLGVIAAPAAVARADDLPGKLVAASRLLPVAQLGRQAYTSIQELLNQGSTQATPGSQQAGDPKPAPHAASTQGAYLGSGLPDAPASAFVRALLDAGVARQFRVTWTRHYRPPTMVVPQMQELGTVRSSAPPIPSPPQLVDVVTTYLADAYVATGPDESFFPHDPSAPMGSPLLGLETTSAAAPPPGIWRASRLCYALIPDRVLEYTDVETNDNGVSEVTAALLFRPERVPGWISDPQVIDTLRPNTKPLDVRILMLRNDGDGWWPEPYGFPRLTGRTHTIAQSGN